MFGFFRKRSPRTQSSKRPAKRPAKRWLTMERLEEREVLNGYSVVNLNDHGAGSLRQAMLDANSTSALDTINFSIAGTIKLTSGALPNITNPVTINGNSAPGFSSTPVVQVDFNGAAGITINASGANTTVRALSLVNSGGNGITINGGGSDLIVGNFIGLNPNGSTANGNRGDGIQLINSYGSLIGGSTPESRNVISSNYNNGIELISNSKSNQISNNYIGTDVTGSVDLGNKNNGIQINGGSGNYIGRGAGNVISGNDANGVFVIGGSSGNTIDANIVGLAANGSTALGNRLDGIQLNGTSNNLIGDSTPVTGTDYWNTDQVSVDVSGWQGITAGDAPGQYAISGTSSSHGLLFQGTIQGVGTSTFVDYPLASSTSLYSTDNLGNGNFALVGTYKNSDSATAPVAVHGFLYQGTAAQTNDPTKYRQVDYPGAKYTFVHSTDGGLVVGNHDRPVDHGAFGLPFGPGHAFIYDIASGQFIDDIHVPGSISNSAYGIVYNGGTSYTIVGGFSTSPIENFDDQSRPLSEAYMVDYDSSTHAFTHWTTFNYPTGINIITHFQGISSVEPGVYTIAADSVQIGSSNPVQGSFVQVRRNADGSFGDATWTDLNYPGISPTLNWTSADSVYGNEVVGIVVGIAGIFNYQAQLNQGYELSNLVSANGGNGLSLYGANNNTIAMNQFGTDYTGTLDRGNTQNGILITASSSHNMIGGVATGGNSPTNGVFVQPPQGNLISGNNGDGVLITGGASYNQLSGNFVGTSISGMTALGNSLDGVGIVGANNNTLLGCTASTDPFVFYNVISGNGNNGLRVTNSNDTTVQGNFFGLASDNQTAVGNVQNGVVVEGSSTRTTFGGPIPLGNVVAANGQNGIYLKDSASYFTSYNTFCGLAAFETYDWLGNLGDGMLITSTGGNNLIRTNVVSTNHRHGIEVSGAARDVRISGNIIGMDSDGVQPMGNVINGIEVAGTANNITIGGPSPGFNLIPHNVISANGGNGVAIEGNAFNINVNYSFIGPDIFGLTDYGNHLDGILVGPNTWGTTIGSTDPINKTLISGNDGNGIELRGTRNNTILGTMIGTNFNGSQPMGNTGSGIYIVSSNNNLIGTTAAGTGNPGSNLIAYNQHNGILVASGSGNNIRQNSIFGNVLPGIDLASGANNNQAAPVLSTLQIVGGNAQVTGSLTMQPYQQYTIEFFANTTTGASGTAYLGSVKVTANAQGVATFTFSAAMPSGYTFMTATATDVLGNTSEFSNSLS